MNPYEDSKLLGEYLLFHYGKDEDIMPWDFGPKVGLHFPKRTVHELVDTSNLPSEARALDLGCAVGASSFELANIYQYVLGIDFSDSFIKAASQLHKKGSLAYRFLVEGNSYAEGLAEVENPFGRIEFKTGDACNLPDNLGSFDLIHAANLICRLQNPDRLLDRLPSLVNKGGQLVLATPFTWLEEFTPVENWIGSGNSKEKLQEKLNPNFVLEESKDLPFVIREHRRKFQFSISLGTRWRRV